MPQEVQRRAKEGPGETPPIKTTVGEMGLKLGELREGERRRVRRKSAEEEARRKQEEEKREREDARGMPIRDGGIGGVY